MSASGAVNIRTSVSIHDQYRVPLEKFSQVLQEFSAIRQRMSLAMRVAIVNAFFVSLLSFVNRFFFFFMPKDVLQSVENRLLLFLSRVSFARLGIFAHLRDLYGIHSEIRDIRLANIAAILSTYIHSPRNVHLISPSTASTARTLRAVSAARPLTSTTQPVLG